MLAETRHTMKLSLLFLLAAVVAAYPTSVRNAVANVKVTVVQNSDYMLNIGHRNGNLLEMFVSKECKCHTAAKKALQGCLPDCGSGEDCLIDCATKATQKNCVDGAAC